MLKLTPVGGHLGSLFAVAGGGSVLLSGTNWRVSKVENAEASGPNGQNGVMVSSEAKTEVPSGL